jgi:hypothetical protein
VPLLVAYGLFALAPFNGFSAVLDGALAGLEQALLYPPYYVLIAVTALVSWRTAGPRTLERLQGPLCRRFDFIVVERRRLVLLGVLARVFAHFLDGFDATGTSLFLRIALRDRASEDADRLGAGVGGGGGAFGATRFFSNWATSLNLTWEVDFWGLFRRNLEAAASYSAALRSDVGSDKITLAARVLRSYTVVDGTMTGEVVELGMFYTVLLETGGWSESGHPTGRRVTFMNGFAIEGHYFNFSTSGRWLWDEIRIAVPTGHDPYPIVEAIRGQVEESTAESARQAEVQWREARRSPHLGPLGVAPSIHLKPVSGAVEIVARYITQVSERDAVRAKLYHTALERLGGLAKQSS